MLVKAKCITPGWDSDNATMYTPGAGPLPDGLYEIERDGPLAHLKLGSTYVFEFDRNAGPQDKPHDYSCKKPGCETLKPFKTLPELGRHSNAEHKGHDLIPGEAVDLSDRTCTICTPHRVCKSPYGLRLHNEKSHPFQSQPEEEVAEPALA
jgi:hypothetical protein